MKGYWNKPEATAAAIQDGWMRTGDAAYMDEDGYVFIYDRVKDMIRTGGESVYPAEVENALSGHPAIADAAVIGVPDDTWGETVKALIVLRPGAPPDVADIIAWARARIANFKAPKSVDFVDSIPRNATGRSFGANCASPIGKGATAGSIEAQGEWTRALRRATREAWGAVGGSSSAPRRRGRRMVKLNVIYTRTGDKGETGLGDGSRRSKSDARVTAMGEVDEANCAIGLAVLAVRNASDAADLAIEPVLMRIQNDLFDLGADLCVPRQAHEAPGAVLRVARVSSSRRSSTPSTP